MLMYPLQHIQKSRIPGLELGLEVGLELQLQQGQEVAGKDLGWSAARCSLSHLVTIGVKISDEIFLGKLHRRWCLSWDKSKKCDKGLFTYYVSQNQGFLVPPSPLCQQWSAFGIPPPSPLVSNSQHLAPPFVSFRQHLPDAPFVLQIFTWTW